MALSIVIWFYFLEITHVFWMFFSVFFQKTSSFLITLSVHAFVHFSLYIAKYFCCISYEFFNILNYIVFLPSVNICTQIVF